MFNGGGAFNKKGESLESACPIKKVPRNSAAAGSVSQKPA